MIAIDMESPVSAMILKITNKCRVDPEEVQLVLGYKNEIILFNDLKLTLNEYIEYDKKEHPVIIITSRKDKTLWRFASPEYAPNIEHFS